MADSEIRLGRVSSVDYKSGMVRVTYRDKDDSVTINLPTMNFNSEYRMPEPGQDVVVAHLSNGSSRGVLLGTVWNKKNIPEETGEEIYRKDFSREKDAAYVRYSDRTGEYLVKAANVHINGVNETILDGPEVEIAANISITLQTEDMKADLSRLEVTGGEEDRVSASIKTDVTVDQEENELEAVILKALFQFVEDIRMQAGTCVEIGAEESVTIRAGTDMNISGRTSRLSGENAVTISSGGTLRFSDGRHSITLAEIIERLGE
jgi:phage baseplate assembly protein gpV